MENKIGIESRGSLPDLWGEIKMEKLEQPKTGTKILYP
jgi:hypothetical protein